MLIKLSQALLLAYPNLDRVEISKPVFPQVVIRPIGEEHMPMKVK